MMEEKLREIRENYPPRKCESQAEFDNAMHQLRMANWQDCAAIRRRQDELNAQRASVRAQILSLKMTLEALKQEYLLLDKQRKEICDVWRVVKQDLIDLNPKDGYGKLTGDS